MRVGILSDTHGDADIAHRAVRLLLAQGAGYLIHCGDVGETDVLDALAGTPSAFVFGNTDFDRTDLANYAQSIGVTCLNDFGVVTLQEKNIAVTHGDDQRTLSRLVSPGSGVDYLLTGHTHQRRDERVGPVRWINPGALHRAAIKTVALLDLDTDTLQSLTVLPDAQK
ncbi:MAG: YfcE family phosphodiesterase [Tepidisphaeraceae bacterium]